VQFEDLALEKPATYPGMRDTRGGEREGVKNCAKALEKGWGEGSSRRERAEKIGRAGIGASVENGRQGQVLREIRKQQKKKKMTKAREDIDISGGKLCLKLKVGEPTDYSFGDPNPCPQEKKVERGDLLYLKGKWSEE